MMKLDFCYGIRFSPVSVPPVSQESYSDLRKKRRLNKEESAGKVDEVVCFALRSVAGGGEGVSDPQEEGKSSVRSNLARRNLRVVIPHRPWGEHDPVVRECDKDLKVADGVVSLSLDEIEKLAREQAEIAKELSLEGVVILSRTASQPMKHFNFE